MVKGDKVLKTCKSTEAVTGCGKELLEGKFQRTKNGGRMKVCRDCLKKQRNKTGVTIRRKHVTSEETNLYSQFDRLMR